jgi:hypothetical protein
VEYKLKGWKKKVMAAKAQLAKINAMLSSAEKHTGNRTNERITMAKKTTFRHITKKCEQAHHQVIHF